MEILLTEDVVGVGDIGDKVRVRAGYARNFLIPRGLAIETQSRNASAIEHHMRQLDAKKKRLQSAAEKQADTLRQLTLEIPLRVGSSGKVFGSINARDIAAKLAENGYELDRRRVLLSEPIKKLGSHLVAVKLHANVQVQVKLNVEALAATKEQEEAEVAALVEKLETAQPEPTSEAEAEPE